MHGPLRLAADGAADDKACREAIRAGSKSFFAASLLLPREVRRSALALYAFCRFSDDLVDGQGEQPVCTLDGSRHSATEHLRARLDLVYAGRPSDHPADRAFARVVARHAIPREIPDALLEGFRWDEEGRTYSTIADLHAYGTRVAATVGAMMTLIMGQRDPLVLARACDLGLAMQLTNIARDVGEDARNGRVYLPLSWLAEAGVEPDELLAKPTYDARIAGVVERLLLEASRLYERAATGVGSLPPDCRIAIRSALAIYRDIGREIALAGHDSVTRRARTTANRKVSLVVGASRARINNAPLDRSPAMPQVRALIDAVERTPPPAPDREEPGNVARVLMLFEALERRDLAARARRS